MRTRLSLATYQGCSWRRNLHVRRKQGVSSCLFWGPGWQNWRELRINPDTLSFDRGNQQAVLYAATSTEPPIWIFQLSRFGQRDLVRHIDSSGVALLRARGVALGPSPPSQ